MAASTCGVRETTCSITAPMCNLYSITTNQAAIIAPFRVMNRYVGNLPPMPGRVLMRAPWDEAKARVRSSP
jgi:hypothetical protein